MAADPEQIATALRAQGCAMPALVIDLAHLERNIAAMLARLGGPKRWRPHVKTIEQARIVTILLAAGMHRTGGPAATWLRWAARAHRPIAGVRAHEGHLGWDDRAAAAQCDDGPGALVRAAGPCRWLVTSSSLAFDHALASRSLRPGRGDGDGDRCIHQIGAGILVLVDVASTWVPARSIGAAPSSYVAARVIARPGPGRITLDAGSKALAPDRPPPNCTVLGKPRWRPQRPSEAHLPVLVDDGETPARDEIVMLIPDHVCTTVNLRREAIHLRDGVPCDRGPIDAGGRQAQPDAGGRQAQPDAAPEGGPHFDGASR